jgi:hypothetical protein
LIGGGALLLITTIVLLLQAAVTGLVADGSSWPVATLIVAAVAILRAQWEILSASYMELAGQSKKVEENDAQYDPMPWDRLRRH